MTGSRSHALHLLVAAMPPSVRALNPHLMERVGPPPSRPSWQADVEPMLTIAGDEITLLLRGMPLPSSANLREHWADKSRRVAWQRRVVRDALSVRAPPELGGRSWVATITRGGREIDDDNLATSAKAVRDALASWLGVDDSPRSPVRWRYLHEPVTRGARFVRIDLHPASRSRA